MIEKIQKSIQLINFSDSIFDQQITRFDGTEEHENFMLKVKEEKGLLLHKFINFNEGLRHYFSHEIDEKEEETLKEILVCHWPFLKTSERTFQDEIKMERDRVERIEWNCYGDFFKESQRKEEELLKFYEKTFKKQEIEEINVLKKSHKASKANKVLINLKSKSFDSKEISKIISLLEASEFIRIDIIKEIFTEKASGTVSSFIEIFNKFTNFLISSILTCENKEDQKLVVMRILKLAKEFSEIGAMNSLKCCMAALESSSIYRLHVIDDQGTKYKKRFNHLSSITSPKGNFNVLRRIACLVPWFGIILKDFTFIKDIQSESKNYINMPLSFCTRKLINSITMARESSLLFYQGETIEKRNQAALIKFWMMEQLEIEYETEDAQYNRSLKVSFNKGVY